MYCMMPAQNFNRTLEHNDDNNSNNNDEDDDDNDNDDKPLFQRKQIRRH